MSQTRTLLLCFIHGFKGSDNTFRDFPQDLKKQVTNELPDHRVESVVYPKYETRGELGDATRAFLEWLNERVLEIRKAMDKPWPPNDRNVGVVLVAHSMGGFVAVDTLFLAINQRAESNLPQDGPIFPFIQGILTFDTPYNGLARSMFVYGAFSNYQRVSSVFNVMTALSAAAPAGIARLASRRAATSAISASARSPAWKKWQAVAVQTGTVGAIAAGGVAAYVHREAIKKSLMNISRESVKESYRQSVDALSQGLAYINRGNVGDSFSFLSDHFIFVSVLLKQKELHRRLERMGALQGVGIHNFYCSLGENGYWQGGYFVPERTFCAVPEETHAAYPLFSRQVMPDDEVQAHMSMFHPEKNDAYESMTAKAAGLVVEWFGSEAELVDDSKLREPQPEEAEEDRAVDTALEKTAEEIESAAKIHQEVDLPSPVDIAAAASLVPQPQDGDGDLLGDAAIENADTEQKRTYMQYLFRIAQQTGTGTGVKGWWPNLPGMPNLPDMPSMPNIPSMPALPNMPKVSSLGQVSMPNVNIFRRKSPAQAPANGNDEAGHGRDGEPAATNDQAALPLQATETPAA